MNMQINKNDKFLINVANDRFKQYKQENCWNSQIVDYFRNRDWSIDWPIIVRLINHHSNLTLPIDLSNQKTYKYIKFSKLNFSKPWLINRLTNHGPIVLKFNRILPHDLKYLHTKFHVNRIMYDKVIAVTDRQTERRDRIMLQTSFAT